MKLGLGPVQADPTVVRTKTRKVWALDNDPSAAIIASQAACRRGETANTGSFYGIAWNGTVFCALSESSGTNAQTSTDGITWVQRTMASTGQWRAIAWNGTVFCAVSRTSGTNANTSTDGITWVQRTMASTGTWNAIEWNGTVFCALSSTSGTNAQTSTDGITWAQRTLPATGTWNAIAWNGKVFCAINTHASGATLNATSTDGITWTLRTGFGGTWVASSAERFCAVTNSKTGVSSISTDGITWTALPFLKAEGVVGGLDAKGDPIFFASYLSNGYIFTDGTTWRELTGLPSGTYRRLAWNGKVFCGLSYIFNHSRWALVSDFDATQVIVPTSSNNGLNIFPLSPSRPTKLAVRNVWGNRPPGITVAMQPTFFIPEGATYAGASSSVWNGSIFCSVFDATANAAASTSTDGITWVSRTMASTGTWSDIAWNGTVFCALSTTSGTNCNTSTDGITWAQRTMASTGTWNAVAWNGTVFCALSNTSGTNCNTSTDGITWVQRTMASVGTWRAIAWNGNVFCALSSATGTNANTSTDGITWAQRTLPTSNNWECIAWNGKVFCALGTTAYNAAVSTDGITWVSGPTLNNGYQQVATNASGVFCAVSNVNSSYNCEVSTDGITWNVHLIGVTGKIRQSQICSDGNKFISASSYHSIPSAQGVYLE